MKDGVGQQCTGGFSYFKVARNSFHFPQTSFTNSFVNTVWFIVSV